MRKAKYRYLVDKAVAAAVAAIEVYNRPNAAYREESFSLLMTNAWELLLKARILKKNGNSLLSILKREKRKKKRGGNTTKLFPVLNRSGNQATIGLQKALDLVRGMQDSGLDSRCAENIVSLMEIRDNAAHLYNRVSPLNQEVLQYGTASLRNFMLAVRRWFDYDLERYNFYLMPVSFYHESDIQSLSVLRPNAQSRNLLKYLKSTEAANPSDPNREYNVSLKLETRLVSANTGTALPTANTGTAIQVYLSEEEIRARYPMDYGELVAQLQARYTNFKLNSQFHATRKPLIDDRRFSHTRLLDPKKPGSGHKTFYSRNILAEFDRHYIRR